VENWGKKRKEKEKKKLLSQNWDSPFGYSTLGDLHTSITILTKVKKRQSMLYKRNMEARSRNYYCRKKQ